MIIVGTGTPEKIGFQAKGYSLTKEQPVEVSMADVKYAQIYGSPGGNFRSADPLRGVFANGNKAIFNYYKKLDLGWTYPDDFIMQERETIVLAINNQFIRAFSSPQRVKKQTDGQLVSELKIQNKHTGQWSSILFNGNANGFRAFGPWIATEEGYSGADRKYTTSYDGKYESAVNRFQIDDYRLTGILYLTHAIDKRFITLDTHEQDSEILLVDNNRVFYRAGDELYGADIQASSLVNNQLLAKDKRIVDVHWMMARDK